MSKISKLSDDAQTPLQKLEHALHPVTAYFILPLFALANAGVHIEGNIIDMLIHPVSLGIMAGIGFTMSIFISGLGFADEELAQIAKIGIFGASLISAIAGLLVLNSVKDKTNV